MRRKIVVSDHCQTAGLTVALHSLLQGDEFYAYSLVAPHDEPKVEDFVATLEKADIWVTIADHGFLSQHPKVARALSGKQIITFPMVEFHAFHPDMTYLTDRRSRVMLSPAYNSRIVFWCWREGIGPLDVPRLFTDRTMQRLGYFDAWRIAERALRARFDACMLDFPAFFLPVKRLGVFMHTMNHPRVETLNALAKVLALKLGAPRDVLQARVTMPDFIDSEIWPVYPAVGERLGMPSGYLWRTNGLNLGLSDYISYAYDAYRRHDIAGEHVDFHNVLGGPDTDGIGVILREQLERTGR